MKKTPIGIIGCGNISKIYLQNLTARFTNVEVKAIADIIPERAKTQAEKFGISNVYSVDEMLADREISLIINLTIPKAHAEVCLAALNSGKHIYVEKPLSVSREDGLKILELAGRNNLLVGCAPDTFMGGGLQTCRKLIDDGWIGRPVAATAFMTNHGHEGWHPDPEFYYKVGGGPMFDMGPYYLTALVSMLGPVLSVSGAAKITYPQRKITSAPKFGTNIDVDIPTHVSGLMEFDSCVSAMIMTSFDIWGANLPRIEIYGSEGSLSVPDPNTFGGTVSIKRAGWNEWKEVPLTHSYSENSRGLGAADMAKALATGRKHRANGELAYHVLDLMHSFHDSSALGSRILIKSRCERPEPLPMGLLDGELD